jgi:hypothetical protein
MAPNETPHTYQVDEPVALHAFGSWYAGRVLRVLKLRIEVEYTTGAGATHIKTVRPDSGLVAPLGTVTLGSTRNRRSPHAWR